MIAKFDSREVPYVHSQIVDREFIGDRTRLAGGTMRQDYVDIKYTWTIETRPMKKTTAYDLIDYLETNNNKVEFWIDDFGDETNTKTCFVTISDEEREQFEARDGSGWQNNGRRLTFEIQEQ